MRFTASLFLLFLVAWVPLSAQTITASLDGIVQDPTGAVVPNAKVVVINTDTNVATELRTDTSGRFVAPSLPAGPYSVTVDAPGFKTEHHTGIVLDVNQSRRVVVTMQLGTAKETINVTAGSPLLDTESSTVGQVVDNRSMVNLPLNGLNPYALVFLTPGAYGSVGTTYNSVNISINGGRPGSTAFLADGVPSSTALSNPIQGFTVFPQVDSVQEFKVESNNYSAELGRSGSGIINLIYKSGTNTFHGTAFEFLRNSDLDANNFFSNELDTAIPVSKSNQYGGTLGGPVELPKLYNGRNKTFFFAAYSELSQGSASSGLGTVPTVLQRSGDFSQMRDAAGAPIVIYDPATTTAVGSGFTRTPFPGNVIPLSRFDPVAKNVLAYYPLPNEPGTAITGANNFYLSGTTPEVDRKYDIKVDENVNSHDRFSVRVSRREDTTSYPNYAYPNDIAVAQGGAITSLHYLNGGVDDTFTVSPTFLIEATSGFARTGDIGTSRSEGFNPVQLGLPAYMDQGNILEFPGIAPSGYLTLGNGGASQWGNAGWQTYSLGIHSIKVFSKHLLKFGYDMSIMQVNVVSGSASDGAFTFAKTYTQGPNPNVASAAAGDAFASFLLGVGSGSLIINGKNSAAQSPYYAWYVADDWKVSSKLTLNIGMRYGLDVPYTERHNKTNLFEPGVASPLAGAAGLPNLMGGLVFVGVNGTSRRPFATDLNGWDPRFGFAYDLGKRTVLRGGFGIFHTQSLNAAGATLGITGYSSTTSFVSAANGVTPTVYLQNPFPGGLAPVPGNTQGLLTGIGTSISAQLVGDNITPYTENWSFNVQHELPHSLLIEAGYVGSRGIHLNESSGDYNLNQLTPAEMALGTQLQQAVTNPFFGLIPTGTLSTATVPRSSLLAPYPQFINVLLLYHSGAASTYHSLQMKAEKRFSSGLSFLVSYTAEKLIDDYSAIAVVGASAGIQNIYDRHADRSVSPNDVSQIFVGSYVYQLPFGKGRRFGSGWHRLQDSLLGGWQLNCITTLHTGMPLVLTAQNTADAGNDYLRPNTNGENPALGGSVQSRLGEYFNTSLFSQPAPFTFGNTGRTLPNVRGPGTKNWDLSLFKNFRVIERLSLQLRCEAFNAFNEVIFGAPNTTLGSTQFGVISTQANTPRVIQLGIKLLF